MDGDQSRMQHVGSLREGYLQSASFSDLLSCSFGKQNYFRLTDIGVITVTVSNRRRRRRNEHYSASQSQKYSSNLP